MKSITQTLFAAQEIRRLPVITAHSGCEKTPANSIEHIKAALNSGAEMLEVDIRRAQGGGLFLSHDVREDYTGCPSLADCFALIAPAAICINCDVKTVKDQETLLRTEEIQGKVILVVPRLEIF